jgi:hypothetical protein
MTTYNQAREALQDVIVSNWVSTPYTFDNEVFNPQNHPWLKFCVEHVDGRQDSLGGLGGRRFFRLGYVYAKLVGKSGTGMQVLDGLATQLRDLFEGKSGFSGTNLRTYDVTIKDGQSDGLNQSVIVTFKFEYEEVK